MDKITPAGAFGFYAGLCLLGWIFVLGCFPETAGLSLEEVKMVFRNGFGIKESQRLRRRKLEIRERDKGRLKALDNISMEVERQVGGDNEKIWLINIRRGIVCIPRISTFQKNITKTFFSGLLARNLTYQYCQTKVKLLIYFYLCRREEWCMVHITEHALGVIGVCRVDHSLILGNKIYILFF